MYSFVLPKKKALVKDGGTLRDSKHHVVKDIEFADVVKTNDKSKFQEIKQPKVRKLLRKPRNKFMLCKNLINKLIYQESTIKELYCVSRIASQVSKLILGVTSLLLLTKHIYIYI